MCHEIFQDQSSLSSSRDLPHRLRRKEDAQTSIQVRPSFSPNPNHSAVLCRNFINFIKCTQTCFISCVQTYQNPNFKSIHHFLHIWNTADADWVLCVILLCYLIMIILLIIHSLIQQMFVKLVEKPSTVLSTMILGTRIVGNSANMLPAIMDCLIPLRDVETKADRQ